MAEISAKLVKELREETGAGMMDCKKALTETGGDKVAATDWLRAKGLSKAAKKSSRTAAEGLVAVHAKGAKAAVIEVNSETDFVARNEQFQEFVAALAGLALEGNDDIEALKAMQYPGKSHSVSEELTAQVATIGENISIRRAFVLSMDSGVVASYIHNAVASNMGKIAVLVALESKADQALLSELGQGIAMHIAAVNPAALNKDQLDPALVARERNVLTEQAIESGKPREIAEKMVEGRMRKFYEEVVLLEQVYVVDGENKVAMVIEDAAKKAGASITLKAFVRVQLGEGIEVEETDFATEVAAAVKG